MSWFPWFRVLMIGTMMMMAVVFRMGLVLPHRFRRRQECNVDLKGKLCLITGGASGLGLELGKKYRAYGADLLIVGRDLTKLEAARQALDPDHTRILQADVGTLEGCEKIITYVLEQDLRVYHLVNNAGVGQRGLNLTPAQAWNIMTINAVGPTVLSTSIPAERHIFIASPQAVLPMPRRSCYAASKAALHSFASCLEMDGYSVTVAYPGWIDTGLRDAAVGLDPVNKRVRGALVPEAVAQAIIVAACSGKRVCCFQARIRFAAVLYLLWPSAVQKAVWSVLNSHTPEYRARSCVNK
ncbi:putative Short-chain dehydrogenase [Giardia muris]|uniref:Putative Short-chain dehydrogenase n=1 Tax=Giardia muris TaxID=5742 RepID=A0A4Z1SRD2_GIAMU|nr:putative Short-chain dehydrogenase [Giardia muris]|eukprot:TNJ27525.1 putative Short-chain dehydrogenase [Giardia muris]